MLFSRRFKRTVSVLSLAAFLSMPVGLAVNVSTAAAAAPSYSDRHDDDRWNDGRYDDDRDRDRRPPPPRDDDRWDEDRDDDDDNDRRPPPPRDDDRWNEDNDRDDDRDRRPPPPKDDDKWNEDKDKDDDNGSDKDFTRGDITTAVLIGGVIGAIIAKNT